MKRLATITMLMVLPVSMPIFADGKFTLSSGSTYTSGDYNSSNTTEILYIPVSLKYTQDKWNIKLTVPYLKIKGPQNVLPNIGRVNQNTTVKNVVNDGLGDITLSTGYRLVYLPKAKTIIDLTGKIKFGTADQDKFLGTGQTDYSLNFGLYKLIGKFTPYATIGRKFYGESATVKLNDVFFASAGLGYKISNKTSTGANFYWKNKTASTRSNTRELSAYMSYKIDTSWKLQGYIIKGLSDNTADIGGGFSLAYKFN